MRAVRITLTYEDGTSCDIAGDAVALYDENGEVSGAIAALIDSRHNTMQQELQDSYDQLEKRVQERTVELKSALDSLKFETEERMQTLAALREREELLIHQSRLATMGEMIDNIAHQWRQPLNILGVIFEDVAMLNERRELTEQYLSQKLEKATDLIQHISDTINAFRYFFCSTVRRESLKTADLIAMALNLVQDSLMEDQIVVEVEVIGAPALYGQANELSQVLLNILLNSRDAFLELKDCEVRRIQIRTYCENGRTIITVADNAGGIAQHIIEQIFDQYVTTKGPDKGTGLGLFIGKLIIEKHMAGNFTVRNIGLGAEFKIDVESYPS
ncbi:ATP-binding protein [Geomonas sp. RF6]|uniref:sensor histidine kinase n=1 Tax=Geomonas sp. RF6 TaxID=2897342 RepID=UPI001E5F746D|nr:ATP-binding protein [Geomonas sp. RF6]UFS72078.1 ATP-binding protein [Geomonas sp. RF6]